MLYSIKQEEFDGRYPQFNGRTLRGRSSQCSGSGENIDTAELYLSDEAEEDEEKTTGTNNLRSD